MTSSRANPGGGYSAFLSNEARRVPASFSMVPGIPPAASLSSTGSSAEMASARD